MQHIRPLLVKIIDTARKILDSDKATLFLYDAATNELWTAIMTEEDRVREIRIPANEGMAGAVFQSGKTLNIKLKGSVTNDNQLHK